MSVDTSEAALSRRGVLQILAGLGVGTTAFQRSLAAQAAKAPSITAEMIGQAEWIAGIKLDEKQREEIRRTLNGQAADYENLRKVPLLPTGPGPAFAFVPAPGPVPAGVPGKVEPIAKDAVEKPATGEELAFLPLHALAGLVKAKRVTSVELTKLYLARLKKYDPALKCVVTYTEDLAFKQAEAADKEIAAGKYRGPLHGIPWGAKDLIAYPGYKTTFCAPHTKDQVLDVKATVARKLEEAGAVLLAKLSLGALAMGDVWYGGPTKNPWNIKQGSSGSSAGSASAVAAGLVGFAIGSETLGSIISPCTRCGATGLRPTFGRISRHACMALSWTMDKLGPIARSVEDCALILGAVHGADPLDNAAVDRPFTWPATRELRALKVGYAETKIDAKDRPELKVLREIGVELVPIELPRKYPAAALLTILHAEGASAFDEWTRLGITEGLNAWPATFRAGEFVPAVEYLRAQRVRSLLMDEMAKVMEKVDLYVGGNDLTITNFTGHPTVVLPNGFRKAGEVETPTAITFTGRLYGEAELLAVARAYQEATGHHRKHPDMQKVKVEEKV